jgi:GT2 family glycosyltransferase
MNPKVSVVMSVYNDERYLRDAVESILDQTFRDFEFIIINDGSTDGTVEIIHSYCDPRIVLVKNDTNVGLTKSLNKGLRLARGEYIARQDPDDLSLPQRLGTQIAYLEQHKHVGLLGTAYYTMDSQGQHIATNRHPLRDTEIRWKILFCNAFCHTSVMFRRKVFPTSDIFYDEALLYSQDYDLWVRLLGHTYAANLQAPLVAFRMHESSITATRYGEQQHIASTIAAQQIKKLLPQRPLTRSEIDTLRRWYHRLPQPLTRQNMELCLVLLQLLSAFEKQQEIDHVTVRGLRRQWIDHILAALPYDQWRDLLASGLLSCMLRDDAISVIIHASKRAIRQIV